MAEPLTIHFALIDTPEVIEALTELEERWAEEPGFWGVPSGNPLVDHVETTLLVEEELYDGLSREDLLEFLGFEPEWVVDFWEI